MVDEHFGWSISAQDGLILSMSGVQPDELWRPETESELLRAAADGSLEETHHLDIKRELGATAGSAKEAARDMASFAIDGGIIIFGFGGDKADPGHPKESPFDTSGFPERVESIARTRCFPPLQVSSSVVESTIYPGTGYVLTRIPPSDSAPHMVDGRYYGRGDKTKMVLSDAQVMLLHERRVSRRQNMQKDVFDFLAPFIGSNVEASGLIGIVGRPTTALRPLLQDVIESDDWTRETVELIHRSGAMPTEHFTPNPSYADTPQRRNGGVALTYGFAAGRVVDDQQHQYRGEPTAVEVELRGSGEIRYLQTHAAYELQNSLGETSQRVARDASIVGDIGFMVRLAHAVAVRASYSGTWRFAIQVHGLTSAVSESWVNTFGARLHPFTDQIYFQDVEAAFDELAEQPNRIAGRLAMPLLYALNCAGMSKWDYLR